ncbi:MAG: hypothetical protein AAF614_30990 [Chloroflexota bacterium]
MSQVFTLYVHNKFKRPIHFGVYTKLPVMTNESYTDLVWLGATVSGSVQPQHPMQGHVHWKVDWGVAILDTDNFGRVGRWTVTVPVDANPKDIWKVIESAGTQTLAQEDEEAEPGHIVVVNDSDADAALGFTMYGNPINQAITEPSGHFVAALHPTYYVALYNQLQIGSHATIGQLCHPYRLTFEPGVNTIHLQVPDDRFELQPYGTK